MQAPGGPVGLRLCNLAEHKTLAYLPIHEVLPCAPGPASTQDCASTCDEVACAADAVLQQEMLANLRRVDTRCLCASVCTVQASAPPLRVAPAHCSSARQVPEAKRGSRSAQHGALGARAA